MQINAQFVLVAMVASSAAAAPISFGGLGRKTSGGDSTPAAGTDAKEPKTFYDQYDKHGSKVNAGLAVTAAGLAIGSGVLAHEASQANDAAAAATAAQGDPAAAVRRSEGALLRRVGPHRSGSVSSSSSDSSGNSVYATPPTSRPASINGDAAPANAASATDAEKAKAAAKTKNGAINNMMGTGGALVGLVGGGVALNNAVESNNDAQAKQAAAEGSDPAANVRRSPSPLTPMNIAANVGMGMMMGGGGGVSVSNDHQDYTQQFMSQGAKHTGASARRSEDGDLLGKRLIPISTSSTKYSQVSQGMEQGASHTGASSGGSSANFWAASAAQPGRQQAPVAMAKRLIPISTSSSSSEQVAQGLQQGPSHTGATSGAAGSNFWAASSAMPAGQGSGMASAVKYGQVQQQQRRDTSQLLFGQ